MNFKYKRALLEFDETKAEPTEIIYYGDIVDVFELKNTLRQTFGMFGFLVNPEKDFPYQIQAGIWEAFGTWLDFDAKIPALGKGGIP